MRRKSCAWCLLVAFALYALVPTANWTWAQDTGDAVAAGMGADKGDQVVKVKPEPKEKGSSFWPWALGIGVALAAGAAGYLIAEDSNASDAKDAAATAGDSAASAEDAAAKAEAAKTEAPQFAYKVHITGVFMGSITDWGDRYTEVADAPAIEFRMPYQDFQGGVRGYVRSTLSGGGTHDWVTQGGDYEQVSEKSILINVDDKFYLGKATAISQDIIRLANGVNLYAQPGAGVYLFATQ